MGGYFQTTKTDAGWNYNVGKSAWNIDVLAYKEIAQLPTPIQDRFISDMAQNRHFKDRYVEWVNNILKNGTKNVELEKTLTWLSPSLIKELKKENYKIDSPIVVISDRRVGHSGMNKNKGQALSKTEYLQIYNIVNNPDEVYYDYTQGPDVKQIAFVKLIPNSDKCIKVCVRFNQKSRFKYRKQLVNQVTTVGKVNYDSLKDQKQFKKIK